METVTVSRFKATCLELLERVRSSGEPLRITRHGEVIAEVRPPAAPAPGKSWLGSFRSSGRIVGDVVSPVLEVGDGEAIPT